MATAKISARYRAATNTEINQPVHAEIDVAMTVEGDFNCFVRCLEWFKALIEHDIAKLPGGEAKAE